MTPKGNEQGYCRECGKPLNEDEVEDGLCLYHAANDSMGVED